MRPSKPARGNRRLLLFAWVATAVTLVLAPSDPAVGLAPTPAAARDVDEIRWEWVRRSAADAGEAGLQWLAERQHPEGYWTADGVTVAAPDGASDDSVSTTLAADPYVIGRTSLVFYAFLMAGHTHRDGRHKEWRMMLRRTMDWLTRQQHRPDTPHAGFFGDPTQPYGIVQHALVTQMLAELLFISGDKFKLSAALTRATQVLLDLQTESGGWPTQKGGAGGADPRATAQVLSTLLIVRTCLDMRMIKIPKDRWDAAIAATAPYQRTLVNDRSVSPRALAGLGVGLSLADLERPTMDLWASRVLETAPSRPAAGLPREFSYAETLLNALGLRRCAHETFREWGCDAYEAMLRGVHKAGPHRGSWDPRIDAGPFAGRTGATAAATMALLFLSLY